MLETYLHTIWADTEYGTTLLDTWSHNDFDENHEGYTEALAKFKSEYDEVREIVLSFPESCIEDAFKIPVVKAKPTDNEAKR